MSDSGRVQHAERVRHEGGCHCGAVRFRFTAPRALDVLDCNCSVCAMTGYRHVIVPHEDLQLRSGGQDLVEYTFGTHTARHLFCGRCGIKSLYQPRSHPDAWSVNLRCVTDGTWELGEVRAFDGRNWESAREGLG